MANEAIDTSDILVRQADVYLREMINYFRDTANADRRIAELHRRLRNLSIFERQEFVQLVQSVHSCPWKSFPKKSVITPLLDLPQTLGNTNHHETLQKVFPMMVARQFFLAAGDCRLDVGVTRPWTTDVDVVVVPGDRAVIGFQCTSLLDRRSGIVEPCLAIQCKAIKSATNMKKSVAKAVDQLLATEGGLVALDISAYMEKVRENFEELTPKDFDEVCSRLLGVFHSKCGEMIAARGKDAQRVAGVLTRGYLCQKPRTADGNLQYVTYPRFLKWIVGVNPYFTSPKALPSFDPRRFYSFLSKAVESDSFFSWGGGLLKNCVQVRESQEFKLVIDDNFRLVSADVIDRAPGPRDEGKGAPEANPRMQ